MQLNTLFNHSNNIIKSLTKLIDEEENSEILNILKKSGGLISLIGIGIEIYREFKKNLKSSEEIAFGSLISITFESANEALEEIRPLVDNDIELKEIENKKEIVKELFAAFLNPSNWNNYLPDHPSIKEFRKILFNHLSSLNINSDVLRDFLIKLNLILH